AGPVIAPAVDRWPTEVTVAVAGPAISPAVDSPAIAPAVDRWPNEVAVAVDLVLVLVLARIPLVLVRVAQDVAGQVDDDGTVGVLLGPLAGEGSSEQAGHDPRLGHGLGLHDAPLPEFGHHVRLRSVDGKAQPGVDQGVGDAGGGGEDPDQAVVAGDVDHGGGDIGQRHPDQVERRQDEAQPFAQTTGPGEQLQEVGSQHDDVGPDKGRADEGERHGLPDMGVEVLHAGQEGPDERGTDGQLAAGQGPAERDAEQDADQEGGDPADQAGDGLGAGAGVHNPLEEQDGHVRRRPQSGPKEEGAGQQDLGIGGFQDLPDLGSGRPGPRLAV